MMVFPTTVHEQSLWLAYLLIAVFLILLFVFRDTISHWKELSKAKIRNVLYDKMIQVSVVGDTAKTSTGFLTVLFNFLDDHFLKPSDGLPYDFLLSEDSDDEDDEPEKKLLEEDGAGEDGEGEDEDEEEGDDVEEDDEGEEEEEGGR